LPGNGVCQSTPAGFNCAGNFPERALPFSSGPRQFGQLPAAAAAAVPTAKTTEMASAKTTQQKSGMRRLRVMVLAATI
jgi:hypothetical protein